MTKIQKKKKQVHQLNPRFRWKEALREQGLAMAVARHHSLDFEQL
jgi:hypothetical protein